MLKLSARGRFGLSFKDEFATMRGMVENTNRRRISAGVLADVATANATDLGTAEALANALKTAFNSLLAIGRTNGLLNTTALTDLTDNSTGSAAGGVVVAMNTAAKFTHVAAQSDLAQTAALNTALAKLDNAVAVLAENVNLYLSRLNLTAITLNGTGAIALSGTIAAITKAITGSDGATAVAASRTEYNAIVSQLRNNFATLLRGFNNVALATGTTTVLDASNGDADVSALTLVDMDTVATSVDNTGDAVSKADADAFHTAFANNVAVLAAKVAALKTACNTVEDISVTA